MSATNEAKEQRRTQILQAVCRCLRSKSSAELTIKDVANEAGVSYGLVHFYFTSKDQLFVETIRYIMKYSEQVILEEMQPYMGRSLSDEEIIAFFRSYQRRLFFSEFAKYQEIWHDLSTQSRFSDAAKKAAAESYASYKESVSEPLGRLISQGEHHQLVYTLMMTYMEGMNLRVHLYGYDPEQEIANGERMLRMLLNSMHGQG